MTAAIYPDTTSGTHEPIESKAELLELLNQQGGRFDVSQEAIRRLNQTDTSVWVDPAAFAR